MDQEVRITCRVCPCQSRDRSCGDTKWYTKGYVNPQVLQTRPRQQRQFKEPKVKCSCSPVFAVEKQFGKTSGYFSRKVATFREKCLLFDFSRKVSTFRLFYFSGFRAPPLRINSYFSTFRFFASAPDHPKPEKYGAPPLTPTGRGGTWDLEFG